MYSKLSHGFSFFATTAFVLGTLHTPSDARAVPGSIGRAAVGSNQDCFFLDESVAINGCTSVMRYDVPLVVDLPAGVSTLTVRVRASTPGPAADFKCELVGFNGFSRVSSGPKPLPASGPAQTISLTTSALLPSDGIYVGCDVPQSGALGAVLH